MTTLASLPAAVAAALVHPRRTLPAEPQPQRARRPAAAPARAFGPQPLPPDLAAVWGVDLSGATPGVPVSSVEEPAQRGAVGRLGNKTNLLSATIDSTDAADVAFTRRWHRQHLARRLLEDVVDTRGRPFRVRLCMRHFSYDRVRVDVHYQAESGSAYYVGLINCGSVTTCPVCAAKIVTRRRTELTAALRSHPELRAVLVTLTLQHSRQDECADLLAALKRGVLNTRSGRQWRRFQAEHGIIGYLNAVENTWGPATGHHPHVHIVLLTTQERSDIDVDAITAYFQDRYAAWLTVQGQYVNPQCGVDVRVARDVDDAASYITKHASSSVLTEALGAEHKRARRLDRYSMWQLLDAWEGGDQAAGTAFVQWAVAMKGRHLYDCSNGLRAYLGLIDQTDEELAQEPVPDADPVVSLTLDQWRVVVANDARAELLLAVRRNRGDTEATWAWLGRIGLAPGGAGPPAPSEAA